MRSLFRRGYGDSPLHLIGHILLIAVAAFAFDQILSGSGDIQFLAWFIGFALLHDLVLVPLYTVVDRLVTHHVPGLRPHERTVPLTNYLRVPALISVLLLFLFAPLISGVGRNTYLADTGHPLEHYFRNWLFISLAFFLASAFLYAGRVWQTRRAAHLTPTDTPTDAPA